MIFGTKNKLSEAEATIKQLQDQLDKYKRHYEKQQGYIEGLYDVVGDLSRQLGAVLQKDNLERLQNNPFLEENSHFFLDISTLFSSKVKKNQNVTCYFGKELLEIKKKFQDRDFKNSAMVHLTERMSLEDLRKLFKDWMWKKPLSEALPAIRKERDLDSGL